METTELTQEVKDNIIRAIQIFRSMDWYWMMVDYGYDASRRSAEATMKAYVRETNKLPDDIREIMRDMWSKTYQSAKDYRDNAFGSSEESRERARKSREAEEEAQAKVAELLGYSSLKELYDTDLWKNFA